MACEICGRNNCVRIFHSHESQKEFDDQFGKYVDQIDDLKSRIKELEKENGLIYSYLTEEQQLEIQNELK